MNFTKFYCLIKKKKKILTWLRLFIYNKNKRNPTTDPWGTPQFIVVRPDSKTFMDIYFTKVGINFLKFGNKGGDKIKERGWTKGGIT